MQPSPYTPGEVARRVPGRSSQLADFSERLSYLADLHRLIGRIRVDVGPRGYGKTSLLREYQRLAAARGVTTVWVTAGESGGLIEQVAAELTRVSSAWSAPARKAVATHVESLTVRVGAPSVASIEAKVHPSEEKAPAGSRALEAAIRTAATAGKSKGLVILVDEIQSADEVGLLTLAYAWQHLQAEGSDVPAAVLGAGLPNTPEAIGAAVSFSERFAYRPLAALDREAEELALLQPSRELGVGWDSAAVTAALDVAQGYPYLLQLIGDATWVAAGRPDAGVLIAVQDVQVGITAMADDLEALFRARWAAASQGERSLMAAMADLGDGPVTRKAIAQRLGVGTDALSMPRARLIDKGFIQARRRGTLEFTIPGFGGFIRDLGGQASDA